MPDRRDPDRPDVAGVIAPPPLVVGGCLLAGGILHGLAPVGITASPAGRVAGLALMMLALPLAAVAIHAMIRAKTHFDPYKPSTSLLTVGIYGRSRNPMYLALLGLAAGIALLCDSAWMLAALIPAALLLRFGVIAREERYLERRFGDAYRQYAGRVRRWL